MKLKTARKNVISAPDGWEDDLVQRSRNILRKSKKLDRKRRTHNRNIRKRNGR